MLFASRENGCRSNTGCSKWSERLVKRWTVSDKPIDNDRERGALLTHFLQHHEPVRDILMISLKKPSKNSCINDCLKFGKVKQFLGSSNHKTWRLLHLHLQYCASSKKNKPELTGRLKLIFWSFNTGANNDWKWDDSSSPSFSPSILSQMLLAGCLDLFAVEIRVRERSLSGKIHSLPS